MSRTVRGRRVTGSRRAGYGLKDGSGGGVGRAGGLRRNRTSTCRHPNLRKKK